MSIDSKDCSEGKSKAKRRRGAKARQKALGNNAIGNGESGLKDGTKRKDEKSITDKKTPSLPPILSEKTSEKKLLSKAGKSNHKKRKQKSKAPKPGEAGFLTATQLRNARKRRAKQRKNQETASGDEDGLPKKETTKHNISKNDKLQTDPSLKYISKPTNAPVVRAATRFFKDFQPTVAGFQIFSGPKKHWRTVSKLPVRPRQDNGKVAIGLFKPNSHEIMPIQECIAHHPSIDLAVAAVTNACNKFGIVPYDEFAGKGYLRYVAINVERKTGKVQLTLVWNSDSYEDNEKKKDDTKEETILLDRLVENLIDVGTGDKGKNSFRLHSLWIHFNSQWKHANNIFDYSASNDDAEHSGWVLKYGQRYVEETLDLNSFKTYKQTCPVKLYFPPNVFRQANIDAFQKIICSIRNILVQYIQKSRKLSSLDDMNIKKESSPSCLELYGGVGTVGLNICDLVSNLISSDENLNNKLCFEKSVAAISALTNGKHNDKNISYIPKNATDMILKHNSLKSRDLAEILIVDPPRKGLDEAVTKALVNLDHGEGPKMIIYVSCGFDAFKKECQILLNSGLWNLYHAEGHLLFPGSDAIETLAVFLREE